MPSIHFPSPKHLKRLPNEACAYCHTPLIAGVPSDEDHVVGLNFVPRGSLAAQWNLILQVCRACNEKKSKLENDLSAISIRPDHWGRFNPEAEAVAETKRKDSALSRRTGKAVKDSAEEMKVSVPLLPGLPLTLDMTLVCGPQMDDKCAFQLAWFHVAAFFYLITYREADRKGSRLPGPLMPIDVLPQGDWGNSQLVGFQDLIANWPQKVHAIGATEFFKVVIHRDPEGRPLWTWALEWNKNYRLFGFFGSQEAAEAAVRLLPVPQRSVHEDAEGFTMARNEEPLAPEQDRLFLPRLSRPPEDEARDHGESSS